jgi:hypothetical protein
MATPDRAAALAALQGIELTQRRTGQAIFYRITSDFLLLWGVVVLTGYMVTQFAPQYAGIVWIALSVAGWLASIGITLRRKAPSGASGQTRRWQWFCSPLALIVFAVLIVCMLGPVSVRQMNAFWALTFALGYTLAGLWVSRFVLFCGVTLAVLTVVGYQYLGPWFALWLGVTWGGSQILVGLYLRQVGARA